jgi:SAM-dependent methyltransferase
MNLKDEEVDHCPCCSGTHLMVIKTSDHSNSSVPRNNFSASSSAQLTSGLSECTDCALVFVSQIPNESDLLEAYSDNLEEIHSSENMNRIKSFKRVFNWLKTNSMYLNNEINYIADIGCASGAFLLCAENEGLETIGFEPSKTLAGMAQTEYGLNVINGVFSSSQFSERKLDMVTLWDVLEHIAKPNSLIKQISASLKPRGLLLVNIPLIDSLAARILRNSWPFYLDVHVLYFKKRTLIKYLELNGYRYLGSKSYWQTLSLGYLISRYIRIPSSLNSILRNVPLRYNMGQTTFLFIKEQV